MSEAIFRLVWWRWMKRYDVVKVVGWRTALVEARGIPRQKVTCCFWIFD
jgi:hypothetical protein